MANLLDGIRLCESLHCLRRHCQQLAKKIECVLPTSNSAGPSTAAAADYLGSMGHLAAEQTADADAGQAYADRLAAILAQGPTSQPLDARSSSPWHMARALQQMKEEDGHACEGNPQEDAAVSGGPT